MLCYLHCIQFGGYLLKTITLDHCFAEFIIFDSHSVELGRTLEIDLLLWCWNCLWYFRASETPSLFGRFFLPCCCCLLSFFFRWLSLLLSCTSLLVSFSFSLCVEGNSSSSSSLFIILLLQVNSQMCALRMYASRVLCLSFSILRQLGKSTHFNICNQIPSRTFTMRFTIRNKNKRARQP